MRGHSKLYTANQICVYDTTHNGIKRLLCHRVAYVFYEVTPTTCKTDRAQHSINQAAFECQAILEAKNGVCAFGIQPLIDMTGQEIHATDWSIRRGPIIMSCMCPLI